MKITLQKSILFASIFTGFALSVQAGTIPATVDTVGSDKCAIREPQENNRPPSPEGLSPDELMRLAQVSKADSDMVKWFVGGQKNFDLLLKPTTGSNVSQPTSGARIPLNANRTSGIPSRYNNTASCAVMTRFMQIVNRDLFMTPKMVCSGGGLSFTFTTNSGMIIMETSQTLPANPVMVQPAMMPGIPGQPNAVLQPQLPGLSIPGQIPAQAIPGQAMQRSLTREPVLMSASNSSDCPIKVTQVDGDGKNLKICLPQKPENKDGEGRASMTLYGNDVSADLACDADGGYLDRVHAMATGSPGQGGLIPPGQLQLPMNAPAPAAPPTAAPAPGAQQANQAAQPSHVSQ